MQTSLDVTSRMVNSLTSEDWSSPDILETASNSAEAGNGEGAPADQPQSLLRAMNATVPKMMEDMDAVRCSAVAFRA